MFKKLIIVFATITMLGACNDSGHPSGTHIVCDHIGNIFNSTLQNCRLEYR